MNPANRTLAFVLVAACSVGIAVGAHKMYQPSAAEQKKTDVGSSFYPSFDPTTATYLGVAAFNTASNKVDEFIVEKREGRWRIPSHHNYPADAKDRVAKTAASMIDVTRGQLVTEAASSHERLNLKDPLDKKVVGAEGRGSRITIKNGDTVLTDLIIGKKEEGGAGGADRYYVRRADEDRVYLAEVRPDLTTKFTDWIQPNVLDATASTFREIVLDRYSVDETKGKIVQGERSVLDRNSTSDEWKLEGLPAGKKLKTSVVNTITSSLADMKIVGVRPKTPGIAAVIKGDAKAKRTAIDMLDMQEKGYFNDGNGGIVSNEGDFLAGTSEGITYVLRFGKLVSGDDVDIEIGDSKKLSEEEAQKALDAKKSDGASKDDVKGEKPADEKPADDKAKDGEKKKENRFLFVTAQLNEKLLGEPPVEPVKPTPPPGYTPKEKPAKPNTPAVPGFNDPQKEKPAEPKKETSAVSTTRPSFAGPGADPAQDEKKAETPAAEEKAAEKPAEKPADKPAAEKPEAPPTAQAPAEKPADQKPAVNPAEAPKADGQPAPAAKDPVAEYEAALAKYEQEMDEYRVKKSEYDERLKKARDREKALNARFADWYYVIPADVFNSINVKPDELVEPESAAPPQGGLPGGQPGGAPFSLDSLKLPGAPGTSPAPAAAPSAEPAPPAEPAKDAPKADSTKPEEAKADTPKGDAPKPDEAKAAPETKPDAAAPEKKPE